MTAFHRRRHRIAGLTLAVAAAAATVALAGSPAHADVPPWQQTNVDPNRVGTLAFYDATGTQVFSGSVNDLPLAAYVAGSDTLRGGDTKAALYAYLPDPNSSPGRWTGSLLTAASAYPVAAAPGAVPTNAPVESGTAGDVSLADFITGHPNTSSDAGYAGVYELRLRTSGEGRAATTTYDTADIQVSGNSWQVVYPGHFTDTTTTLAVSPNTGLHAGTTVTLTATVGPSAATGTVHFSDGSTTLGTAVAVSGGVATKTVKITTAGSHTFHAAYSGDATFAGSTGSRTVAFAKAVTTTAGSWPATSPHYGTKWTVKATVAASGITPTGTVNLKSGSKTLASGSLSSGQVTLSVPGTALAPGTQTLTLVYAGSANAATSQATKQLTVGKAIAHVTNKLASSTVKTTAHAKLTVTVTAAGTTPTGKVAIYDGTRQIASGTLTHGTVTTTLPLLKAGKHSIHASYAGSSLVGAGSAASVTLTVVR